MLAGVHHCNTPALEEDNHQKETATIMKSSQERSNECLPPKKRELLVLEERALAAVGESQRGENLAWLASVASMASMAPVGNQSGNSSAGGNGITESPSPSHEILSVVTEFHPSLSATSSSSSSAHINPLSVSSTSMPRGIGAGSGTPQSVAIQSSTAVLSSAQAQPAGAVQYAQLPPNLQLIGPYTGYISSQVLPPGSSPATMQQPATQRPPTEAYVTAVVSQPPTNGDQPSQHHLHHSHQQQQQQSGGLGAATLTVSGGVASPVPQLTQPSTQCIQLEGSSLGMPVASPTAQLPLHIHPHSATVLAPHTLTLGTSQLLVHYADAPPVKVAEGGQTRELYNGEVLETGVTTTRLVGSGGVVKVSTGSHDSDTHRPQAQSMNLAARTQVLLPAEYTQESAALHASLMLVPSSATADHLQRSLAKDLPRAEKGGICLGKPISRDSRDSRGSTLSLSSLESLASPAPTLSPHTLLQPAHATSQEVAAGIYSATTLPIIGYISGGASQQASSYHGNLTQHLLISGSPSLLIPVTAGAGPGESETTPRCVVTAPSKVVHSTNPPASVVQSPLTAAHAYISPIPVATIPDSNATVAADSQQQQQSMLQNHQHVLQVSPQQAHMVQLPPQPPPASPSASLPPYFMRGSIIQLADGELKRVEDLKTEDFIQSAEVSGDLKIDSSTVERIDCSHTPDVVIIQFSVGEHKAQVRVEVLVEYPFFVFGQGWSSCCPDKTTQLLELSCAKLAVGDVCISLTLRSLRNGSLKREQTAETMGMNNLSPALKPARVGASGLPKDHLPSREVLENGPRLTERCAPGRVSGREPGSGRAGTGLTEQHIRTIQAHSTFLENGRPEELQKSRELPESGAPEKMVAVATVAGRKRRWSAPEKRDSERVYEETSTAALPKHPFIPQEVKISIEGRSSTGR